MLTKKTQPISEQDLQKTTEKYLSELKAQDEGKFNRQLKEQLNDIITAITNLIPPDKYKEPNQVQHEIKKHINAFWLRYKKIEGPKPDQVAKRLIAEFKDYFVSLIQGDNAQNNYSQDIKPTDKEIIALNQIADMFLETKDQKGFEDKVFLQKTLSSKRYPSSSRI